MKKVYIVRKNGDFTEGRGPMNYHRTFSNGPEAVRYVQAQEGIFGSPQHVELDKYGHYAYANGYSIDEEFVYESAGQAIDEAEEKERVKALNKLTARERKLLGL
jgi:hypothetical protein